MIMNVYDFDKTIFKKDSTILFYIYCLKTNPLLLRFLPKQVFYFLKYKFKKISKTKFKEKFFCFLRGIKNLDSKLEKFWVKNKKHINEWYLKQKKDNDIIISASPEFLLQPICNKLNLKNLIATKIDSTTGEIFGENCYGEEKVYRFKAAFPNCTINCFYSDSLSDALLAKLATKAYLVKKGKITPWENT